MPPSTSLPPSSVSTVAPHIRLLVVLHGLATSLADLVVDSTRRIVDRSRDDRGQATTEYALVLLAAALVALLVVAWATAGGGAARISRLFNRVIDAVVDRV